MKINYLLFGLVAFAIILTMKKEKFVEVMGFAGMSTKEPTNIIINDNIGKIDETGYTKQEKYNITPDIINDIVKLIQKYLSSKYGMCAQPIETNYIHKYTSNSDPTKILYKTRMMFMKSSGFPYAFAVSADISVAGISPPILSGIYTQQTMDHSMESIQPYENDNKMDFENFQDILAANIPRAIAKNGQKN
jgi:hypothetical protein